MEVFRVSTASRELESTQSSHEIATTLDRSPNGRKSCLVELAARSCQAEDLMMREEAEHLGSILL